MLLYNRYGSCLLIVFSLQLSKYLKLEQKGSLIAEYVWIDAIGETRSKSRVSCPPGHASRSPLPLLLGAGPAIQRRALSLGLTRHSFTGTLESVASRYRLSLLLLPLDSLSLQHELGNQFQNATLAGQYQLMMPCDLRHMRRRPPICSAATHTHATIIDCAT